MTEGKDKKSTTYRADNASNKKLAEILQKQVNWHEQKNEALNELIRLCNQGLLTDTNGEHLQSVKDKYGAFGYDIMKFTKLCPKKLVSEAIKGHEEKFADNPIISNFLADRNSMTAEKALEFFAGADFTSDEMANVLLKCDKDGALKTALLAQESLKNMGVKQSVKGNSKITEKEERLAAAIRNRIHHPREELPQQRNVLEGQFAAQADRDR